MGVGGKDNRTRISELEKARGSTRAKSDGDSNEIDESDSHHGKQHDPRISIDDAVVISDEFAKQQLKL
jgi:hypothetical protein